MVVSAVGGGGGFTEFAQGVKPLRAGPVAYVLCECKKCLSYNIDWRSISSIHYTGQQSSIGNKVATSAQQQAVS